MFFTSVTLQFTRAFFRLSRKAGTSFGHFLKEEHLSGKIQIVRRSNRKKNSTTAPISRKNSIMLKSIVNFHRLCVL